MVRSGLFVFLLLLLSTTSWAQDSPSRAQVFGGYSYAPSEFGFVGGGANGWKAALDVNSGRTKWLGFTADFSRYYGASSTTSTFLFGPRVSAPLAKTSKVTPFGHFLIGGAHISNQNFFSTGTSFAWDFGGGVDFSLSKHFALRGEGDYLHNHFVTADNQLQPHVPNSHGLLSTGIVFRF